MIDSLFEMNILVPSEFLIYIRIAKLVSPGMYGTSQRDEVAQETDCCFFPCYAKIEIACGGSTGMQVWDLDSNVDVTGIWWRGSGHHFQNNISKMNPESVLI